MTKNEINGLYSTGKFSVECETRDLKETHISWVILCDRFVFKIKRPVHYQFLDFSTLEKRKYYCDQEILLNRRLTTDVYLETCTVRKHADSLSIGTSEGEIIDYAVKMRKLDPEGQMDTLLKAGKVTENEIETLARILSGFHRNATIIEKKNPAEIKKDFSELAANENFNINHRTTYRNNLINKAVELSDGFINDKNKLLIERVKKGFFRDCHGDLHSRNIFLRPYPVIFDCIEFNDSFRQTDVLNEIAFLCMDLDAFGYGNLSDLFLEYYNELFPVIHSAEDRQLFLYYKSYRANIRAKVNFMRARDEKVERHAQIFLNEADRYLKLMEGYLEQLV